MYGAMVLTRYNFGKHSCQVQFRATNVPSNREVWAPSSPLKVAGTDVEDRICEELVRKQELRFHRPWTHSKHVNAIFFFWQPHFPISSTKNLRGPDDASADVYFNKTSLPRGFEPLRPRDRVRYELRYDNWGRTYAVNVSVEGNGGGGDRGLATVVGY